jgi:hypothetical protein
METEIDEKQQTWMTQPSKPPWKMNDDEIYSPEIVLKKEEEVVKIEEEKTEQLSSLAPIEETKQLPEEVKIEEKKIQEVKIAEEKNEEVTIPPESTTSNNNVDKFLMTDQQVNDAVVSSNHFAQIIENQVDQRQKNNRRQQKQTGQKQRVQKHCQCGKCNNCREEDRNAEDERRNGNYTEQCHCLIS